MSQIREIHNLGTFGTVAHTYRRLWSQIALKVYVFSVLFLLEIGLVSTFLAFCLRAYLLSPEQILHPSSNLSQRVPDTFLVLAIQRNWAHCIRDAKQLGDDPGRISSSALASSLKTDSWDLGKNVVAARIRAL
jgi:hypothetical protein